MSPIASSLAVVLRTVRRPGDIVASGTTEIVAPRLDLAQLLVEESGTADVAADFYPRRGGWSDEEEFEAGEVCDRRIRWSSRVELPTPRANPELIRESCQFTNLAAREPVGQKIDRLRAFAIASLPPSIEAQWIASICRGASEYSCGAWRPGSRRSTLTSPRSCSWHHPGG
jgi:hypothetical protein